MRRDEVGMRGLEARTWEQLCQALCHRRPCVRVRHVGAKSEAGSDGWELLFDRPDRLDLAGRHHESLRVDSSEHRMYDRGLVTATFQIDVQPDASGDKVEQVIEIEDLRS